MGSVSDAAQPRPANARLTTANHGQNTPLITAGARVIPLRVRRWRCPVIFATAEHPTFTTELPALTEPERTLSYEGRRFKLVMSGGAPTARSVMLEFHQNGDIVTAFYSGDGVGHGALVAVVRAMGCLEGRFHHVTDGLHLETGRCWATPQATSRGRMRLYFEWQMEGREGVSVMEET